MMNYFKNIKNIWNQLKIFYEEKGFEINNNFLKQLELYTDNDQFNYNAYLLADNNTISIRFGKYEGIDAVNLIENHLTNWKSKTRFLLK